MVITVYVDLVGRSLDPFLAVMHDSRRVHEIDSVRVIRARGELQGKKVLVEAHGCCMGGMCLNCGVAGSDHLPTEAVPWENERRGRQRRLCSVR